MTVNNNKIYFESLRNLSVSVFVQVSDLQRSLKASQAKEQEALERSAAAVTQEQKAIQDSLLQVCLYTHTYVMNVILNALPQIKSLSPHLDKGSG